MRAEKNPDNILYFANGSIGDFLMVLYFMENVYGNAGDDTKLHIVVPRNKKLFEELTEAYPYIHIIEASKSSLGGLLQLFKYGWQRNYVITPPTSGTNPFFLKLIARLISLRPGSMLVGFDDGAKVNKMLYTKQLNFDTTVAFDEHMRNLLREVGYKVVHGTPSLVCKNIKAKFHDAIPQPYVVVHPFGSSKKRSKERGELVDLIRVIKHHFPGHPVVITGSPEDKEVYQATLKKLQSEKGVHNLVGEISILELCTLVGGARLFVGVDTGITHLACFLGKQSIVLAHFATMPTWLPYYNENATILYHVKECSHDIYEGREHLLSCCTQGFRCMDQVPEHVINTALAEKADKM